MSGAVKAGFNVDLTAPNNMVVGMFEVEMIDLLPIKLTPVNITNKMLIDAGGAAPKSEYELDSDTPAQKLAKQQAQAARLVDAKRAIYEQLVNFGVDVADNYWMHYQYMQVVAWGLCGLHVYCPRDDGAAITCTPLVNQTMIADTISVNTDIRIDHWGRASVKKYEDVVFTGADFQTVKYGYDSPQVSVLSHTNFTSASGKPAPAPKWDTVKKGFISDVKVFGVLSVNYDVGFEVFLIQYDLPRPLTAANKLAFFYGTGLKDLAPAQIIVQRGGQGSIVRLPQKIEPSAATWEATGTNSTHTEDADRRKTTKKRINGSDGRSWIDVEIPIEVALVNGMGKAMTFKMPDIPPKS